MKKCAIGSVLLLLAFQLQAQVTDVLDVVKGSRNFQAGCEAHYSFGEYARTQAPEGYEPFYISHYGRHGSRYAWDQGTYTRFRGYLDEADQKGLLTGRGRKLYEDYIKFAFIPTINAGDLSRLGWEQHIAIAKQVASDFPEVFRDSCKVYAYASTSQRAIVSMAAFCTSLSATVPSLKIEGNSLHENMTFVNAPNAPKELRAPKAERLPETEDPYRFRERIVDIDDILSVIFTDAGFLEERKLQCVTDLHDLWRGHWNYDDSPLFENIFTQDQILQLWEADNYLLYYDHMLNRPAHMPLIKNILTLANEAIAGSGVAAHLRFGHDTVITPLFGLFNINDCAHPVEKTEDVKYWFQSYNTSMAATFLLVLYRSPASDEILFKVLRNGIEVSLPQLTPVQGPYYKWNDLQEWFGI